MARRRRHRRFVSRSKGWHKWIPTALFGGSFVTALMSKDFNTATPQGQFWASGTATQKGEMIANAVVGRISGFNVFPQAPQFSQSINPMGIFNGITYAGAGLFILNAVGKMAGIGSIVSNTITKSVIKGGVLGGFFDPATGVRGGATTGMQGITAIGARATAGNVAGGGLGTAVAGFAGSYSG